MGNALCVRTETLQYYIPRFFFLVVRFVRFLEIDPNVEGLQYVCVVFRPMRMVLASVRSWLVWCRCTRAYSCCRQPFLRDGVLVMGAHAPLLSYFMKYLVVVHGTA